ncbi:hypothetical protein QQ045_012944 [Rhodiola kirilowii]
MTCLRSGVTQRDGLCIISDRHIGIMRAMEEVDWSPPRAYHRVCLRHFVSNSNQKAKCMAHKKLLYNIAEENQQIKFCNRLKELLKDKPEVIEWFDKVNPETWALTYDSNGRRWGSMTTNRSESFNYVLMACRDLPITAIVHFTFKQANSWFIKRRDEMIDWNNHHVLKIESIINDNIEKVGRNEVQMYDRAKGIASVFTKSKAHSHKVSIIDKTCSCRKWQLFHYPCCHALAVCHQEGISTHSCVAYEYTTQAYNDTWAPTFNQVPDMRHWKHYDGPKHIPGKHYKRLKRGRHPTKRRHNEMARRRDPRPEDVQSTSSQSSTKAKRVFKCSICGVAGHTKKSLAFHGGT